jgi:fatty-acyl-CoA synthase
MLSTMQDRPLNVNLLFRGGAAVHPASEVVTNTGEGTRRATFREVADRAARLAGALKRLGVGDGDRVGTFLWNTQEHLEAYFAVPCMGAVLHTLNLRLFPDQLAYVVNHAADKVVLVDATLLPLLARVRDRIPCVERFILVGDGDASALGDVIRYEEALAAQSPAFDWPDPDERSAAAMCYTSGTTGNPKGVAYSHRSTALHAIAESTGNVFGFTQYDRILILPSMFHANAWGLPYAAWMSGADILLPGRFVQAEPLCRFIAAERPTFGGAVPTVWNDVLRYASANGVSLSCFRLVLSGGSAVPPTMFERFWKEHGVKLVQGWGMTETSPLAAISGPPKSAPREETLTWLARTGRLCAGIDMRLTDGDRVLPWDGESIGEIEVRGPWVTGSYYAEDARDKFHDGWLRTGDVGAIDPQGVVQITDRAKDVIKSGGEWISSVELENALMGHPDVIEAAVIGVPDERWDERPLACVVLKQGSTATVGDLRDFLSSRVAKWWLPEQWSFIDEVPKTSVGKFDKKVLRARHADGTLAAVEAAYRRA